MLERYVKLNKLMFTKPFLPISKEIESKIQSEVAECLSIGQSIFYINSEERVNILMNI